MVVVGAGVVGLATARTLARRGHDVTVVEKEHHVAAHQTGRNSGVIHSGLYYAPGSLKATMGVAGARSMRKYAESRGVAVEICGKLVVATGHEQIPALKELLRRGEANGVSCREISPAEAREFEPHVSCVAALRVESTGIVDYRGVSEALAGEVEECGGRVVLETRVTQVRASGADIVIETDQGVIVADQLINCAGLFSDRLAKLCGLEPDVQIVPFRGEYFDIGPAYRSLVRGLIYPVPDPAFPFLGVHLTRTVTGGVHAGPNAVVALAREGYSWGDVRLQDLAETVRWPGTWRLARQYWRVGTAEIARSASRRRFVKSLQTLVPEIPAEALIRAPSGVRAQALRRDGSLVEDFHVVRAPRQLHVLNAPSPAATAALEIGRQIASEMELRL